VGDHCNNVSNPARHTKLEEVGNGIHPRGYVAISRGEFHQPVGRLQRFRTIQSRTGDGTVAAALRPQASSAE